jgi:hypothetical protein
VVTLCLSVLSTMMKKHQPALDAMAEVSALQTYLSVIDVEGVGRIRGAQGAYVCAYTEAYRCQQTRLLRHS